MDQIHDRFPTKAILHTEGCIDNIGNEDNSPKGSFLGWKNDAWWWTEGATDWGWYWASKETHPKYAPVHRYARDLVDGLNHWFVGWIDWNIVLDKKGGPNHANNLCAAPIMVDTDSEDVYVTPLFYVMAHFSRYLHPGDSIVQVATAAPGLNPDDFHVTAAISKDKKTLTVIAFNKAKQPLTYNIQVGGFHAPVTIPENAIQTLRFDLRNLK
jgi:glucosylceramidase